MRWHQQLPSCTGDHFPAAVTTTPAPATTSLRKQLQSCIGDHLPAPAATSSAPAAISPGPVTAFLHQRSPSCTSRYQQLPVLNQWLPFLHQQLPLLNQRPPFCTNRYQSWTSNHLFNDYQSCTCMYQSCTSNSDLRQWLDPAPMITIQPQWLFAVGFSNLRFAIIKFGLSKQHPCFVILA